MEPVRVEDQYKDTLEVSVSVAKTVALNAIDGDALFLYAPAEARTLAAALFAAADEIEGVEKAVPAAPGTPRSNESTCVVDTYGDSVEVTSRPGRVYLDTTQKSGKLETTCTSFSFLHETARDLGEALLRAAGGREWPTSPATPAPTPDAAPVVTPKLVDEILEHLEQRARAQGQRLSVAHYRRLRRGG